jgi:hypothetical protein
MMKPIRTAQDRAKYGEEPALDMVRGGSICDATSESGHLVKGSNKPAICVTTPPKNPKGDPRPRWRVAGEPAG